MSNYYHVTIIQKSGIPITITNMKGESESDIFREVLKRYLSDDFVSITVIQAKREEV